MLYIWFKHGIVYSSVLQGSTFASFHDPRLERKTKKGTCLQLVQARLAVIPFLGELMHQALHVGVPGAAIIMHPGLRQAALHQCLQQGISMRPQHELAVCHNFGLLKHAVRASGYIFIFLLYYVIYYIIFYLL